MSNTATQLEPETREFISRTASDFNRYNQWDIEAAHALAIEVLADVNDHGTVRLFEAAQEIADCLRELHAIGEASDCHTMGDDETRAAMERARVALAKLERPDLRTI
jgi:hypothetical protein